MLTSWSAFAAAWLPSAMRPGQDDLPACCHKHELMIRHVSNDIGCLQHKAVRHLQLVDTADV